MSCIAVYKGVKWSSPPSWDSINCRYVHAHMTTHLWMWEVIKKQVNQNKEIGLDRLLSRPARKGAPQPLVNLQTLSKSMRWGKGRTHKSKKVETRGGSGMQRTQPRWWCCRSGEEAWGPGTRRRRRTGDDGGGSLTWSGVDGGGATAWWSGRRGGRRSSSLKSATEMRHGVAVARVERSGGLAQGKLEDRVGRPPVIGLPNDRN
jgi:hypothetical protein